MRQIKHGAGRHKPPKLHGYFWTSIRVNAPWDRESAADQCIVGDSPHGIAIFDTKTGIVHHRVEAKPNAIEPRMHRADEIEEGDDIVYSYAERRNGVTIYVVERVKDSGCSGIEGEFRTRAEARAMEIRVAREMGAKRVRYRDLMNH